MHACDRRTELRLPRPRSHMLARQKLTWKAGQKWLRFASFEVQCNNENLMHHVTIKWASGLERLGRVVYCKLKYESGKDATLASTKGKRRQESVSEYKERLTWPIGTELLLPLSTEHHREGPLIKSPAPVKRGRYFDSLYFSKVPRGNLLSQHSCLSKSPTLVLKPFFPQSLSLHSHISFAQADVLEFEHSAFGSHWRW